MQIKKTQLSLLFCFLLYIPVSAQDSFDPGPFFSLPDKFFTSLDKKAFLIGEKLNKQTNRYLHKFQKQENKLRKKLYRKDSILAKQLFAGADEKYRELRSDTASIKKYSSVYSGHLDSLSTALSFLKDQNLTNHLSLQKTLDQYRELQQRLTTSDQIKKYLVQREHLLKQQFQNLGMIKELKKFRKDVYYYRQQIREYKEAFEDPDQLEEKLMEMLLRLPQFKDFFAKNSMLCSLFALPGSNGNSTASLQGLQTRTMVNQSLIDRFGNGANITQQLEQNVRGAQSRLNDLKNKAKSFSSGSYGNSGDEEILGFKPNNQKTKSFLQRLEYGTNVQSQNARYFFPVTSDIGLSVGYKLNDKSSIGVGASYKLGWGNNWNQLHITHQGVGLRSYLDWKVKGSFFISGGYEQNYRSMINSVDQSRGYSWQTSGLVGISKKYNVSNKIKGEMKLMWDFMSYQQVPKAQPIIFRIGYSLK